MRDSFVVMKKELRRFFTDPRLLITSIFLPGIIIFIMYSFIGSNVTTMIDDLQTSEKDIAVYQMPESVKTYFEEMTDSFNFIAVGDEGATLEGLNSILGTIQEDIDNEVYDAAIIFMDDFDERVFSEDPMLSAVEVFYDAESQNSVVSYQTIIGLFGSLRESILRDRFDTDAVVFEVLSFEIEKEESGIGQEAAGLIPMLTVTFLFAGAMSIGPDMIAGEKERGTIATVLVTPIKRRDFAVGKILGLSVMASLAALSSFIGIMFSLPKLTGGEVDLGSASYGFGDMGLMLIVLLSLVLVIVGVIAVISAFAKSVKEASTMIVPFYFVSVFVGLSTLFSTGASENTVMYLVPVFNAVHIMIGILNFETNYLHIGLALLGNISLFLALVLLLTRMFGSERMMNN
jgi:sodium transport system permease protein